MTQNVEQERRAGLKDRRIAAFDRRQFVDIAWPLEKDRRMGSEDRRKTLKDRREV